MTFEKAENAIKAEYNGQKESDVLSYHLDFPGLSVEVTYPQIIQRPEKGKQQ